MRARIDRDDRIDGQQIARLAAAAELEHLAGLVLDDDRRPQVLLATGRTRAPVDDHTLGDTGRFVERFRHRLALDQVLKGDAAFDLGEDRPRVGIPLGDALAALDLVAFIDQHAGAVLDTVHSALGAVRIEHRHHHVADHGDGLAVRILHDVAVLDLDACRRSSTR